MGSSSLACPPRTFREFFGQIMPNPLVKPGYFGLAFQGYWRGVRISLWSDAPRVVDEGRARAARGRGVVIQEQKGRSFGIFAPFAAGPAAVGAPTSDIHPAGKEGRAQTTESLIDGVRSFVTSDREAS